MKTEIEKRHQAPASQREMRGRASLEKRAITDAEKAEGYIGAITGKIPFNSDSQILSKRGRSKPFVERIAPDAFKKSISEDRDIMATAGHSDDPLAAFAVIGKNLSITTTDGELRWEALIPDTRAGKDLLKLVDMGIISGTSFEFEVRSKDGEKWEKRDANTDERTILDAKLLEFNPVKWPAYLGTSLTVEMRRAERATAAHDQDDRSNYYRADGIVDYYDPTITADSKFAANALNRATWALTDALDYLRAAPAGLMADYAKAEVAASAASATTLIAWLAANGATVNPALQARAADKLAEARAATAKPELSHADNDRERRFRILQLDSR